MNELLPRHGCSTDGKCPRDTWALKDGNRSRMDQGVPSSTTVDEVLEPREVMKRYFGHIGSSSPARVRGRHTSAALLKNHEMG